MEREEKGRGEKVIEGRKLEVIEREEKRGGEMEREGRLR